MIRKIKLPAPLSIEATEPQPVFPVGASVYMRGPGPAGVVLGIGKGGQVMVRWPFGRITLQRPGQLMLGALPDEDQTPDDVDEEIIDAE